MKTKLMALVCAFVLTCMLAGCAGTSTPSGSGSDTASGSAEVSGASADVGSSSDEMPLPVSDIAASSSLSETAFSESADSKQLAEELFKKLKIKEDYRKSFKHGDKGAEYQKYIVLHDTEGEGDAQGVIDYWDGNERGVAAHFIVNKDGTIMQCVPLDKIAHHAGYGDTGHNKKYGVEDESRDDKVGTTEIGDWASDYGMNSYSVGIEMIHVGGSGDYPEKQLKALDGLIAYIDAYYASYGIEPSTIIDHKAWRTGNSDTSEEFARYLKNYQDHRTHLDADSSESASKAA